MRARVGIVGPVTDAASAALLLCRKKECPFCAKLPIRAGGLGCHHIVVGSDISVDRLITDLEDAPEASASILPLKLILARIRRMLSHHYLAFQFLQKLPRFVDLISSFPNYDVKALIQRFHDTGVGTER